MVPVKGEVLTMWVSKKGQPMISVLTRGKSGACIIALTVKTIDGIKVGSEWQGEVKFNMGFAN